MDAKREVMMMVYLWPTLFFNTLDIVLDPQIDALFCSQLIHRGQVAGQLQIHMPLS